MSRQSRTSASNFPSRPRSVPVDPESFQLGEWLWDLWEGRYFFLATLIVFTLLGGFLAWRTQPVYQAEALLRLNDKKPAGSDPAFSKVEGLFAPPSDAQAEVEILKSDLILGRTVRSLALDLSASPKLWPVIGAPLARRQADPPRLELATLDVPDYLAGKVFRVVRQPGDSFHWYGPDGENLGEAQTGQPLSAELSEGARVGLRVRAIHGKPGQVFLVSRAPLAAAIDSVRSTLDVAERGDKTNVIGLSLRNPDPQRARTILNDIVSQYTRYILEQKTGDADKAKALVESQLGPIKARLDAAEERLNQYRSRYGSVDVPKEADALLAQTTSLAGQISALNQKKQEALRTYRENSDVVTTINDQIAKLETESAQVGSRIRGLPKTEQEVVRLTRDVQVNTELYTSLLNNIQQLQLAGSGDIGAVATLGQATVNPIPVGPKPSMMVAFFALLGAFLGLALAALRQLLRRGVRDHRVIESKLGIPVLVTIPHSREQKVPRGQEETEGPALLATKHPDDLAVESMRTLRTTLLFAMKNKSNRTLMVTSPSPATGKSFICSNLALLLGQTGARVLLVDTDLRRGMLHQGFGLKTRQGGLSDVLKEQADWRDLVHATGLEGLDFLSTGLLPGDPSQLLLSKTFARFVEESRSAYDYVIFDVPPLLPVSDATIVGAQMGTVFLAARFGQHPLDELAACQQRLEDHHIPLAGCLFNDLMPTGLGYGYQAYRYAYHYHYK